MRVAAWKACKKLKIATWNVNSVRHRINLVTRFLRDEQPDVLCLQETKVMNELFPAEAFRKLGYVHQAIHGQKAYHGVAVLAKKPFRETGVQDFCREGHARHMGVTLENGVELHNFYVPAGGDIPDPEGERQVRPQAALPGGDGEILRPRARRKKTDPVILVGDLNVAPLENDVWSHKQLLGIVSHTPVETKLLGEARPPSTGPTPPAISFRRKKRSIPGGAIAPRTGKPRTAAGGWIMSGPARA